MIDPKPGDEGRRAWYSPPHSVKSHEDVPGVVTSWNDSYVFHRADGEQQAKACARRSLFWEGE